MYLLRLLCKWEESGTPTTDRDSPLLCGELLDEDEDEEEEVINLSLWSERDDHC